MLRDTNRPLIWSTAPRWGQTNMMVVNKVVRNIGHCGRGGNMFSGIKKIRGAAVLATSGLVVRSLSIQE